MQWYHIEFSYSEILTKQDENFIRQFVTLTYKLNRPKYLGLYSSKCSRTTGLAYYILIPNYLILEVKELLDTYSLVEVEHPDVDLLQHELGQRIVLEQMDNL